MATWTARLVRTTTLLVAPVALATFGLGCWTRDLPTIGSGSGNSGGSVASGGGQGGAAVGAGGAAVGAGGAKGGGTVLPHGPGAAGVVTSPNKLDVLLMVDNSMSMGPLQAKMAVQLPNFLNVLRDPTTGLFPDLHIGIVSSSFGGGAWGNVNQCGSGSHPGDDEGKLQQGPGGARSGACAMLHRGETFLKSGDGSAVNPPNFDGDIGAAFQCIALIGDTGCGFESQFESVLVALAKAADPMDPDNGGFLRPDARLAIVMLTNEDDCSVAPNSLLLNPAVNSAMDPSGLGALWSYRCNEFGHLCGGQPPPHGDTVPPGTSRTTAGPGTGGLVLNDCVSADDQGKTDPLVTDPSGKPDPTQGHLYGTIPTLVEAIKSFKANPNDVFVAAIAGPTKDASGGSLYRVYSTPNAAAMGELDPAVDHSCVQASLNGGDPESADPAVRIKQLVDSFGANGAFYPICAPDFNGTMTGMGATIHARLGK